MEIKSECDSIIAFMHHLVCSSCLMSYELCFCVFDQHKSSLLFIGDNLWLWVISVVVSLSHMNGFGFWTLDHVRGGFC